MSNQKNSPDLLKEGANKKDTTFTWSLVEEGDLPGVQALLDAGADPTLKDSDGNTALHIAAFYGKGKIVKYLLTLQEQGVDINCKNKGDRTPLMRAAQEGDVSIVKMLVEAGADPTLKDSDGNTALHIAAFYGRGKIVAYLLTQKEQGVDINCGNKESVTPLILAAQEGDVSVVKMLVEAGADPTLKDSRENTALHIAAMFGKVEPLNYLLTLQERGVDKNCKNKREKTPLMWACKGGHLPVVQALLEAGADINCKDDEKWTPVIWACNNGHLPAVQALLKARADINCRDNKEWTPVMWASEKGYLPVVQALVEAGADLTLQAYDGDTALHKAVVKCRVDIVKYLLELKKYEVDIHCCNKQGKSPLTLATESENSEITALLEAANAKYNMSFKNYFNDLCSKSKRKTYQVDEGIEAIFTSCKNGKTLCKELEKYFNNPLHKDEKLLSWLKGFKEKYQEQFSSKPEIFTTLKENLLVGLSLYKKKEVNLSERVRVAEFHCVEGSIARIVEVIEGYYGAPELQCMNMYLGLEAGRLTRTGKIGYGNEQHLPTALKYLLGFLGQKEAKASDPAYTTALSIHPAEIFRIREGLYKYLNGEMKKHIIEKLDDIIESYEKGIEANPTDFTRYNELNRLLEETLQGSNKGTDNSENVAIQGMLVTMSELCDDKAEKEQLIGKLPEEHRARFSEGLEEIYRYQKEKNWEACSKKMEEVESEFDGLLNEKDCLDDLRDATKTHMVKNLSVIDAFVSEKYPIPRFVSYDDLIEMPKAILPYGNLEVFQDLHILEHAGYIRNTHRDLKIKLGGNTTSGPSIGFSNLAWLIISCAPFSRIEQCAANERVLFFGEVSDIHRAYESIAWSLAGRKNGGDIYRLIKEKVSGESLKIFHAELLSAAVMYNNPNLLTAILEDSRLIGESFEFKSYSRNMSALEIAAKYNKEMMYVLIDKIKNSPDALGWPKHDLLHQIYLNHPAFSDRDKQGFTSLMQAVIKGDLALVQMLIGLGANVSDELRGETALHLAAKGGQVDILEYLLMLQDQGVDINCKNKNGQTPVMCAIHEGHLFTVQVLVGAGADLTLQTFKKNTALHIAAFENRLEILNYLLTLQGKGADINCRDSKGQTPVILATQEDHLSVVQVLVEAGADPALKDGEGHTALHVAAFFRRVGILNYLLTLQGKGVDINCRDKGDWTPLMMAAQEGPAPAVQALLEAGADPALKNANGRTALHIAAFHGQVEVLNYLCEEYRKKNISLDTQGNTLLSRYVPTPFYLAAQNNHIDAAIILLQHGASPHQDILNREAISLPKRLLHISLFSPEVTNEINKYKAFEKVAKAMATAAYNSPAYTSLGEREPLKLESAIYLQLIKDYNGNIEDLKQEMGLKSLTPESLRTIEHNTNLGSYIVNEWEWKSSSSFLENFRETFIKNYKDMSIEVGRLPNILQTASVQQAFSTKKSH